MPYFTIVTTCFNSEKTIRDTLKSVLRQTFYDYEYIVIDAKSTDSTIDILDKYVGKFGGRLRYISEPDKGIYDGMNKGVKMAKGKYISILNADDYYNSHTLEKVYEATKEKEKAPIVFGDICRVKEDKKPVYRYHFNFERIKKKIPFGHPSMFLPRNIYDEEGVYDSERYSLAADQEFQMRLYAHMDRYDWTVLDELFTYMREGGATDNPSKRKKWIRELADIDIKYKKMGNVEAYIREVIFIYGRVLKNKVPYELQKRLYRMYRT